jgi:Xaa-Pro dipeptidase
MTAEIRYELAFPDAEYARRMELVQAGMRRRELDGILVFGPANLYYLTGYETIGFANFQLALVPRAGEPRLLVRELEGGLARHGTWLTTPPAVYADDQKPLDLVAQLIGAAGLSRGTLGVDMSSSFLTVRTYQALVETLPEVTVADSSGVVESVRRIKSDLELACFRQAAKYTAAGMASAVGAVRAGATDNDIGAAAAEAMYRDGSEYFASGPTVTSGRRSGIPHTTFQRHSVEPGDGVLIEIGGNHHRYTSPLMRSVLVQPASDLGQRMYQACSLALDAAIREVRPGAVASDVHMACQRVIDEWGFEPNFRKRLGYGMGVGFAPTWGEGTFLELSRTDHTVLEAGMVFHLPPALRVDAVLGVGCSETVAVTESGAEVLGSFPRDLVIV